MLPEITEPAQILAPIVAFVVAYVLFYEGLIHKIDDWQFLRNLLPFVDDEAREQGFYTSYSVNEREHVGNLKMGMDDARSLFVTELGFIKVPLAAHKEDWEGRREVASLGLYGGKDGVEYTREDIDSWGKLKRFLLMTFVVKKQLHVTLFYDEDTESVVVTGHWEWSPYNVFKAYKHFRGKDYDVETGVRKIEALLSDVKRFEPKGAKTEAQSET